MRCGMENEISTLQIEKKIFVIRGVQVMIDRDIAELYGVETRVLNQAVKRNIERFPEEFMFQLTREEIDFLKSQIVISREPDSVMSQFVTSAKTNFVMSQIATSRNNMFTGQEGGTRKLPFAFTEQGCAMLSSVLRSETEVQVSIQIMKAFVSMHHFVQSNSQIFAELKSIREHQLETDVHLKESDKRIDQLFTLMDKYNVNDTQRSFFFPKSVNTML